MVPSDAPSLSPSRKGLAANPYIKFVIDTKNEKANGRRVWLAKQPFAQGGLRNVYHMTQQPHNGQPQRKLVAKESRHEVQYNERLAFHRETFECQRRAAELAAQFNERAAQVGITRTVEFLEMEVFRISDPSVPGKFRYLAVEPLLSGGNYEKFNSNEGFVLEPDRSADALRTEQLELPQAFSHFTHEATGGDEMVVDIQGSANGCCYTDPQLHSRDCRYGRADRGEKGFVDFFASHRCNSVCRRLALSPVVGGALTS